MSAAAFAHRADQAEPSPEMLAYLSMGGTLEELCSSDGPAHHLTSGCEACRITANALTPETTPDAVAPLRFARVPHAATGRRVPPRHRAEIAPPSRAPPL